MINIDLDKAKAIGHDIRRAKRAEELEPYDRVVSLHIPGAASDEAEAERQAIREKYAEVQAAIEAAATPDEIKAALSPQPEFQPKPEPQPEPEPEQAEEAQPTEEAP